MTNLDLPLEEYFRYHPPQTAERKAAHNIINSATLELCRQLIESDTTHGDSAIQCGIIDNYHLTEICQDEECNLWISDAINRLKIYLRGRQAFNEQCLSNKQSASEVLKYIQQIRMFLNQGVTLDELRLLSGKTN
jgi:hypothetical protein